MKITNPPKRINPGSTVNGKKLVAVLILQNPVEKGSEILLHVPVSQYWGGIDQPIIEQPHPIGIKGSYYAELSP